GLKMFDEAAFKEDNRPGNLRENLEAIRDHEQAHVDFLTETISEAGGEPVEEADYDFGYDDIAGFLEVAMALENVGVSAYAGAAPSIKDEGILAAALGVLSVEARHAAYLNARNGKSPFPDAFDEARTREEVLELAGPFIAGEGTPTAKSAAGTTVAVNIDEYEFLPAELEIAAGTTVMWTNVGQVAHTATAEDETFDTGVLGSGKSGSYTFEEPGTYPYICTLHPSSMKATVVVT
ncbi:MAG: ferritin-like domain-containing protein, partial [Chloroflexota bacterium]|nr:ferritin-like domain-containing protein [Chloroflexota bacterium]